MPIKRLLPIEAHAICDALYFSALLLLAAVADFGGQSSAATYAAALAIAGIGLYVVSAPPLGLFAVLAPRWHSVLEYLSAPLTMVIPPLLFPESPVIAWGLPVLGALNLAVNALSDYPRDAGRRLQHAR